MTELAPDELLVRVRVALRRRWPEAEIGDLERLPGGLSSLTFAATLTGAGDDAGAVVVKVAPPDLEPVRNRDVLRQARVISAVHGAPGARVPEVLVTDAGAPPFFVMEFVAGESYEPKWDRSDAPPEAAVVGARARAAARMLAALQAIDPAAVGLESEPVLSPGEELQRWARLFATAGDDLRGDEDALRAALTDRLPTLAVTGARPAILHGDYRLGNMQFDGEHLAAVIDWELASVGDPRNDLAWLLVFTDPVLQRVAKRDPANRAAAGGMPSADELLREYLREAGDAEPPPDLDWFTALSYYKLGATMAVLAKRNRRLDDPDPGLEVAAQTTPPMLTRARELLA